MCKFSNCDRKPVSKGYCHTHYYQFRRGVTLTPIRKMSPRGTGSVNADGYRMLYKPKHPNAQGSGRISEHRYVMSEMLRRPLETFEEVHHKNGNKLDNAPKNLELWVRKQPPGQRAADLLAWAREIIELYEGSELDDSRRTVHSRSTRKGNGRGLGSKPRASDSAA